MKCICTPHATDKTCPVCGAKYSGVPISIYIWPDGTWVFNDNVDIDLLIQQGKSDDYAVRNLVLPDDVDIDEYIEVNLEDILRNKL